MPATRRTAASNRQSTSKTTSARSSRGNASRTAKTSGGPTTRSRSKSAAATRGRSASRSRATSRNDTTSRTSRRARRAQSSSDSDRSPSRSPAARPKRAMTAYMAFIQSHMKNVKLDRAAFGARTKELGAQWKSMSAEQKAEYQAKADQANINRPARTTRRRRR